MTGRKGAEQGKMKINYKRFYEIIYAAEEQPDKELFLVEYGLPEWILSDVTDNEKKAVKLISDIHTVTHMSPAELVKMSGMSKTVFAGRFMIPLRTVQNWTTESDSLRTMPIYTKFLIAEIIGLFGDLDITT